jgi:hypothetical protein
MASFAKLNSNNIVERVESVVNEVLKDSNNVEQESIGIDFLKNLVSVPVLGVIHSIYYYYFFFCRHLK